MNTSVEKVIQRYFTEIVEKQELESADQILHPKYRRDPEGSLAVQDTDTHKGVKSFKDRANRWNEAFKSKLIELEIMTRDSTALAIALFKVKQIGSWFDLEPQSKEVNLWAFCRFVIKDEKIYSIRNLVDYHKFWSDLGHSSIFNVDSETDYLTQVKRIRFNS